MEKKDETSVPDSAGMIYLAQPNVMSNAQAALIAAAAARPHGMMDDIRELAAEFAIILDNVDAQNQAGGIVKRRE
jgi:hypothetical protein